jgi:DNA-3-methyladenine glycosylase II
MTPTQYLTKRDPKLAHIIREIRLEPLKPDRNHFRTLVLAIIDQQLSTKAGATIARRVMALYPKKKFPTPEDILRTPSARLRTTGMSGAKVSFVKDLAKHVHAGVLQLKKIARLPDDEVMRELVAVKGIGPWTAEMFMMFSLGRPDIFSPGDLGLRNAIRKCYGLRRDPSPRQLKKISDAWRPYRTLACRYLWRSLA